ncbi:MAG: hypothetical protein QME71_06505 [Dehalococcoidia bacterium]|nr:hypothetical protein [Dehalococcoidia bacterium]
MPPSHNRPIDQGIAGLPETVRRLPASERERFERIFRVDVTKGRIVPPEQMRPWIERYFGSVEATLEQTIVHVTDLVTGHGALFNPLRSRRPHIVDRNASAIDLDAEFGPATEDPLEDPYSMTPADEFGRVEGRFCVTGSNVAKFDGFHALVIFKERNPLSFTREMLHDYVDTGLRWAQKARETEPEAKYFLFMWNCLWRAGASLAHGHAQVMLGRGMHYPAVERARRAALAYRERHNAEYFDDLYHAHQAVGAAFEKTGARVLANLAPTKENEVLLIAPRLDAALVDVLYDVLACYRDRLGVASFNLAVHMPPLAPAEEDWSDFPIIIRLVDRGDLNSRTSDIGAMELYAASVIASDPLLLARLLRDTLGAG